MRGPADMYVTGIRFQPRTQDASAGLLGWVSFTIGVLWVDGVAVRRTAGGRPVLSFPCRRDRAGREHAYVRPVHDRARQAIEVQILTALGFHREEDR